MSRPKKCRKVCSMPSCTDFTNGNGHGALVDFLKSNNVDTLICGGIGGGAKQSLAQSGIQLYGGVTGDADKAVEDLLANRLIFNPDVECNHHHGNNHTCI